MQRFDDLRKSLLDMDPEELREKVRQIRRERRIVKEKPATKVAKKVRGNKAKGELEKLMNGMTPDQLQALLETLEDGTSTEHTT